MSQNSLTQKLNAFLENQKKDILNKIQEIVRSGDLGKDYTISQREKNKKLRHDYCVTDKKIKEILLGLTIEDFIKIEDSNNEDHLGDIVCKFEKVYALIPRWEENADSKDVSLYIKMIKPEDGKMLFIISFHEKEL